MHLTNNDYFNYGKNPEDSQIEPHAGIKMALGLVSPSSISVAWIESHAGISQSQPEVKFVGV